MPNLPAIREALEDILRDQREIASDPSLVTEAGRRRVDVNSHMIDAALRQFAGDGTKDRRNQDHEPKSA